MVMKVKEGYNLPDPGVGKRDFRDSVEVLEGHMLKNPRSLIFDGLLFLASVVYVPIRNLFNPLFSKPKSLKGKVCFVTGSGRGLGRGICIALAKEGAIIACADIHEENNNKTVQILTEMGAKAKAYTLNVENKEEVLAVAKKVESDLGRVYLLLNNPDKSKPKRHDNFDEEYIRRTFSGNILGPIWTIGAFLPKMKEINEGHIVNISSIGGVFGTPESSIFCASMAALSNYSQAMRLELFLQDFHKIYVTAVHVGMVNASYKFLKFFRINTTEDHIVKVVMDSIHSNKADVSTNSTTCMFASLTKFVSLEVVKSVANFQILR